MLGNNESYLGTVLYCLNVRSCTVDREQGNSDPQLYSRLLCLLPRGYGPKQVNNDESHRSRNTASAVLTDTDPAHQRKRASKNQRVSKIVSKAINWCTVLLSATERDLIYAPLFLSDIPGVRGIHTQNACLKQVLCACHRQEQNTDRTIMSARNVCTAHLRISHELSGGEVVVSRVVMRYDR